MKRFATAMLAALSVYLAVPGCSGAQRAAEQQALVCAESAAAKDIGPTVEGILVTGGTGWEAALAGLGVTYGIDVVNCAVQLVEQLWAIHEGSGAPATVALATNAKLVRAQQWLAAHGGK